MQLGNLADHFEGVAAKVLSEVDTKANKSHHQNEVGSSAGLRALFGRPAEKLYLPTRFLWLTDDLEEPVVEEGLLTFYDTRRKKPHRPAEFRCYYPRAIHAMDSARPGDIVFIAKKKDGSVLFIGAPAGSSVAGQLEWMFGTGVLRPKIFSVRTNLDQEKPELGLPALYLLELLGVVVEPKDDNWLGQLLTKFGPAFPTTANFGAFTRDTLVDLHPKDDPDGVLLAWLEREEILFRTLERHIFTETTKDLDKGDIDQFAKISLSLHNRRKSRAGKSLENHLVALFDGLEVRYSFNQPTEDDVRPDFIFPGIEDYRDKSFPSSDLTMLGAKTTCKDRWRQVLSEATRVEGKHLLTLESPISVAQTKEMQNKKLQLVVPRPLQAPYKKEQQMWLMDVAGFTEMVRVKEQRGARSTLL